MVLNSSCNLDVIDRPRLRWIPARSVSHPSVTEAQITAVYVLLLIEVYDSGMKNVVVDALRRGTYTSSMPHFHNRLYNPWICKYCGAVYDLFAFGNYAYPPKQSGDIDSSVASLHKALLAGCEDGHKATHLRSSNGDPATVLQE